MQKCRACLIGAAALLIVTAADGQTLDALKLFHVHAETAIYRGQKAIHVTPEPGQPGPAMAVVTGSEFQDGTIELQVAGTPAAGADSGARGFIGAAFRVPTDISRFEMFYLRPTNGRADDQLRRNHSTQYVSEPDWPWERLRRESPGVYESYVDLEPGAWTRMKIVVEGSKARLFVNGAEQPCLIVNDLKLGPTKGAIALWVGPGTDGYFRNLRVSSRP